MSVSEAEITFATDLFAPLGTISSRKMMGGLSIYCEGQIFSILSSEGMIYLKAKGDFAGDLAEAGARQFSFVNKAGKPASMGYWTLPEAALDEPDLACDWAKKALSALE